MDEKPNEIMQRIEQQRNRLGQTIDELENRVRDVANVRQQFEKHPMVAVGLAFGGGLLLSGMIAGGSKSRSRSANSRSRRSMGSERSGYRSSSRYAEPGGDYEAPYSSSVSYGSSSYRSGLYGSGLYGSSYSGMSGATEGSQSKSEPSYEGSRSFEGSRETAEPSRSYSRFSSGESGRYSGQGTSATMSQVTNWLQHSRIGHQKDQFLDTLDQMGAALIELAAEKFKDMLDSAMPGFKQHLPHSGQQQGSSRGQQFSGSSGYGSGYGSRSSQYTSGSQPGGGSQYSSGSQHGGGSSSGYGQAQNMPSGSGAGSSAYDERGRQHDTGSSRSSESGPQGPAGSRNWSTEPAQQGSFTNQGQQQATWRGANPAQAGERTSQGNQGKENWSSQSEQDRSRRLNETRGTVQQDDSGSSYENRNR